MLRPTCACATPVHVKNLSTTPGSVPQAAAYEKLHLYFNKLMFGTIIAQ
jgi:hypothetical protein